MVYVRFVVLGLTCLSVVLLSGMTVGTLKASGEIVLKIATLAPEGSIWMNELNRLNDDLMKKTEGQVRLKLYPGGIMGDDDVVMRKIRVGQLDGAAFTTNGMSGIEPQFRTLSLPAVFNDNNEIDAIIPKITPELTSMVRNKGFEILGIAGLGFTYMFTKIEVTDVDGLKKTKPWLWENDVVMKSLYKSAGITPVAVGIGDVMTGLETGMLDAVFNTPAGLLALQWFTKVKYMIEFPMSYSFGSFFVSSRSWDKISPELQMIVRATADDRLKSIMSEIRKDDQHSLEIMKERGLQIVKPQQSFIDSFNNYAGVTQDEMTSDPESQAFFQRLRNDLNEHRQAH